MNVIFSVHTEHVTLKIDGLETNGLQIYLRRMDSIIQWSVIIVMMLILMTMTVTSINLSDAIFGIIDRHDIIANDLELECIILAVYL